MLLKNQAVTFIPSHPLTRCKITAKTKHPTLRQMCYAPMNTKKNFQDPLSNSENPKMKAKTTSKKHSGY